MIAGAVFLTSRMYSTEWSRAIHQAIFLFSLPRLRKDETKTPISVGLRASAADYREKWPLGISRCLLNASRANYPTEGFYSFIVLVIPRCGGVAERLKKVASERPVCIQPEMATLRPQNDYSLS